MVWTEGLPQKKERKKVTCKTCLVEGHNTRTCLTLQGSKTSTVRQPIVSKSGRFVTAAKNPLLDYDDSSDESTAEYITKAEIGKILMCQN